MFHRYDNFLTNDKYLMFIIQRLKNTDIYRIGSYICAFSLVYRLNDIDVFIAWNITDVDGITGLDKA